MRWPAGRQLLFIAVMFSFLLHAAYAYLVFKEPARKQEVIPVQLVQSQEKENPKKNRQKRENKKGEHSSGKDLQNVSKQSAQDFYSTPVSQAPASKEVTLGKQIDAVQKVIGTPVSNTDMQKALRRIRHKIAKIWKKSESPFWGKVVVSMELDTQGRIVALWLQDLEGTHSWGQHILELVRKAAPFPQAMRHLSEPMELE